MARPADRSGDDLYVPVEWEAEYDAKPPPVALSPWRILSLSGRVLLVGMAVLVGAYLIAWMAEGVARIIAAVLA